MPEMPSDREAHLLKVISKLEAKVRSTWEDNNSLKQRAELAQLDKEIAEEQSQEVKAELDTTKARIKELEELVALSDELEASYIAERQGLEAQKLELERQLNTNHWHTQQFESLQLDLRETSRLLELANLELLTIKEGVAASLGPRFGDESEDWLLLIDFLKLDISDQMQQYKKGDLSDARFASALRDLAERSVDEPATYEHIHELPTELRHRDSPLWHRVAEALSQRDGDSRRENTEGVEPTVSSSEKEHDPTLQLRISVLESKLSQAQEVAKELDQYRERLRQFEKQHSALESEVLHYRELASQREKEVAQLRRQNLPNELLAAQNALYVSSLQSCVSFLSTARPSLVLDELALRKPAQISALAGHKRVRHLRALAPTFGLANSPEEARKLAIEQRAQLMLL